MFRALARFFLGLAVCLPAAAPDTRGDDLPPSDGRAVALIVEKLASGPPANHVPARRGDSSQAYELTDGQAGTIGYAFLDKNGGPGRLREIILEGSLAASFQTGAAHAAQRAVGSAKRLADATFSYDGLLSYNLTFPYIDKSTGRTEGKVAVDALTGRLSLPGGSADAVLGRRDLPVKRDFHLLDMPRFDVHLTQRATALAMLFSYLAESGFPTVGRKKTKDGVQTEKQYIEEFSRACGACSERTATEIFVTGRTMMAKIGTYRPSRERPLPDLAEKVVAELDAGRPVYARINTANVNHFIVICGYAKPGEDLFLIARLPAAKPSSRPSDGFCAFALPAAFDSAEFVTVELKGRKGAKQP